MMHENFYIELPSNVMTFADNTVSSFTTRLNRTIILDKSYEVGLAEIDFTYSWFSIPDVSIIRVISYNSDGTSSRITVKKNPNAEMRSLINQASLGIITEDQYAKQNVKEYTKSEKQCLDMHKK